MGKSVHKYLFLNNYLTYRLTVSKVSSAFAAAMPLILPVFVAKFVGWGDAGTPINRITTEYAEHAEYSWCGSFRVFRVFRGL